MNSQIVSTISVRPCTVIVITMVPLKCFLTCAFTILLFFLRQRRNQISNFVMLRIYTTTVPQITKLYVCYVNFCKTPCKLPPKIVKILCLRPFMTQCRIPTNESSMNSCAMGGLQSSSWSQTIIPMIIVIRK